jgi:aminoglycoside phosphotransferase (APT) family kinase protein
MDHGQRVKVASELVGWPTAFDAGAGTATASGGIEMKLLEGGLTGKTFGLRKSADAPYQFVVRMLSSEESEKMEHITRALSAVGVTPPVIAANTDLLITEFMNEGKSANVASFGGVTSNGCAALEGAAHTIGTLHNIPLDSITGTSTISASAAAASGEPLAQRNDLAFWMEKAEAAGAGLDVSLGSEVAQQLRSEVATAASAVATALASTTTESIAALISSLGTSHGDLHPGNILLFPNNSATLVDLEHCSARQAGSDLAYFFAVWGDLLWMSGFTPGPTQPYPYPPIEARRCFASAYINSRRGTATEEEVEEMLFEIERSFARTERLRLMIMWALIAKGDPKHMLAGAVGSFLPHLQHSLELLQEVCSEEERANIVKRGLIVMAAERANAVAASA